MTEGDKSPEIREREQALRAQELGVALDEAELSSARKRLTDLRMERKLARKADKPTRVEAWASRADTWSAPMLRACLRVCAMVAMGLAVGVLTMLVFFPSRIPVIVDLIRLVISSGSGFAVPAVVLAALLPRLIRSLAKEGE